MYFRPQLTDRLLMGLGRQAGPAVDQSAKDAIVQDAAQQFARQKAAEDQQAQLDLARENMNINRGLGERRLAQSGEQFQQNLDWNKQMGGERLAFDKSRFNQNLGLIRDDMQTNRRLGNTSALISGLGLGVEGVRAYQANKRQEEYRNGLDSMIGDYEKQGTDTGNFYAQWAKILRDRMK